MFTYPDWVRDPQSYEIEQERYRHEQTLWTYGEYVVFCLLWRIQDHEAGRVNRCPTCYVAYGKVAEVYKQPSKNKCPDCFGTTFEGGYRALIVRPSLWAVNEEEQHAVARGETIVQTASVQSTPDFRLHTDDYIFRSDGTRWQARTISNQALRSGFEMPEWRGDLGWNVATVSREDEDSVAYLIPPSTVTITTRLDVTHFRYPEDFSDLEVIRADLI